MRQKRFLIPTFLILAAFIFVLLSREQIPPLEQNATPILDLSRKLPGAAIGWHSIRWLSSTQILYSAKPVVGSGVQPTRFDLITQQAEPIVPQTRSEMWNVTPRQISPDGKWLLYARSATGKSTRQVTAYRLEAQSGTTTPPVTFGQTGYFDNIVWMGDSRRWVHRAWSPKGWKLLIFDRTKPTETRSLLLPTTNPAYSIVGTWDSYVLVNSSDGRPGAKPGATALSAV